MRQVRARDERTRRGELATAVDSAERCAAELAAAAQRVESYTGAIGDAVAVRERCLAGGTTIAALTALDRYLGRIRRDRQAALRDQLRAQARHDGQRDAVDAARGRLGAARADRERIERHFATWRAERDQLAERRLD
jgi:hypothetical protein